MLIHDPVYGSFDITEPVLLELINSKPLQRLKGISQYGLPPEFYHHRGFSRYDHCLGAMLLLRKLGASLQEQIAGLLHDVSHTAFSHVVDWVLGSQEQEDYQDLNHEKYIRNSQIPSILQKYGLDVAEIIDPEKYSLLEQPSPNLCADRVDYALRECLDWAEPNIVPFCVSALIQHKGKMIFTSREAAEKFSYAFLKCQTQHWGSAETGIRYSLLANALKRALEIKLISMKDLYQDDEYILRKLKASTDRQILASLSLLSHNIKFKVNLENPQYSFHKKFRYIDPEFLQNKIIHRLSSVDKSYAELLEKHRKINEQGIKVSLLS
ncbi:MAG: HD domain-containing protein [Nanoarchaeota archaeon]|nr:HD domain-containing protein [Nanoarchaeota archaeon]